MSISIRKLLERMYPEGISRDDPVCYVEFGHLRNGKVFYQPRIAVFGVEKKGRHLSLPYCYVNEDNSRKEVPNRTWTLKDHSHTIQGLLPMNTSGGKKSVMRSDLTPLIRVKA